MPNAPAVTAPAFGVWLATLWEGKSYEQVALKLRPHAPGQAVNRSSVKKLEQGRVPNWTMAYAISQAFGVPFMEVIARLASGMGYVTGPLVEPGKVLVLRENRRAGSDRRNASRRSGDDRRKSDRRNREVAVTNDKKTREIVDPPTTANEESEAPTQPAPKEPPPPKKGSPQSRKPGRGR